MEWAGKTIASKKRASIVRIKKKGTPKSDGRISVTNSVRKFPPDI
jgi:hypothetical protein